MPLRDPENGIERAFRRSESKSFDIIGFHVLGDHGCVAVESHLRQSHIDRKREGSCLFSLPDSIVYGILAQFEAGDLSKLVVCIFFVGNRHTFRNSVCHSPVFRNHVRIRAGDCHVRSRNGFVGPSVISHVLMEQRQSRVSEAYISPGLVVNSSREDGIVKLHTLLTISVPIVGPTANKVFGFLLVDPNEPLFRAQHFPLNSEPQPASAERNLRTHRPLWLT